MHKKYGKFRVFFDLSTQTISDKMVLNHITTMDLKAIIDFGQAKMKLFLNIYNWRLSFHNKTIYLVLADITAGFCFPKISAEVSSTFGFLAEGLYFYQRAMSLALTLQPALGMLSGEQFKT
jgi:hypothetical protein